MTAVKQVVAGFGPGGALVLLLGKRVLVIAVMAVDAPGMQQIVSGTGHGQPALEQQGEHQQPGVDTLETVVAGTNGQHGDQPSRWMHCNTITPAGRGTRRNRALRGSTTVASHSPTVPGARHLAWLLAVAVLAVGCRDDEPPVESAYVSPAATEAAQATGDWLAVSDKTPPARWLMEHRLDGHHANNNQETLIAQLLTDASRRFQEHPRMIANRALQLQSMLADADMAEDAIGFIRGFLDLSDRPGLRGFSANCQHCFNLRQQGHDPGAALALLADG